MQPDIHPPAEPRFEDLGLDVSLLKAIRDIGHEKPTPIQAGAIPAALLGRDILGAAQTGTGKTAAFALPILQRLSNPANQPRASAGSRSTNPVRALILSPTRELASQIGQSFAKYARHCHVTGLVVYGGVNINQQIKSLRGGVDVLVATPGRLCDLMQQGVVDLSTVEIFVLDEADRMLDEGFLPDVRRVLRVIPSQRQTMFFSATMPREIQPLANEILKNPVRVEVTPVASTPRAIEQSVFMVEQKAKRDLLAYLLTNTDISRAIVFTRTKHGANRVAEQLSKMNVRAQAIHGNKSQGAREHALGQFREGSLRVLVATDLASRGIDVTGISHVVNFDIPTDPEAYVHRIGRTARAGTSGVALSFCSPEERGKLSSIEKLIRTRLPVQHEHPFAGRGSASHLRDDDDSRAMAERRRPGSVSRPLAAGSQSAALPATTRRRQTSFARPS